ncbi:YheU family protein [Pseudocolwellia sp. HL-MZ19]|uniref:YheU family protein n=1 Tax=unclassified Pseudocolwellia TaxID=2848178 RepID=UPI003CF32CB8
MIIPIQDINPDTLFSILKEFVLREGTEYGAEDVSIEEKVEQVRKQLDLGTAVLVYSELHETVNIIPKDQFEEEKEELE